MARNWLMGSYVCNLGHNHSTENEAVHCNNVERERDKREHQLQKESVTVKQKEDLRERRKSELERKRMELDEMKIQLERERAQMKHEEKMAQLQIEQLKAENRK